MKKPSKPPGDTALGDLIGLGEHSYRKSYYPELQRRLYELERFKAFVDNTHDAIFLAELPSARIVDVNESACRQLGYGRAELLGRMLPDISDLGQPLPQLSDSAATERLLVTSSLIRANGSRYPAELTLARMDFEELPYAIVVARDISRRRKAEMELVESENKRQRLQTELECAARMQSLLLPTTPPEVVNFEIAASCLPAHQVGGDFFDWQEASPGLLTVTFGDVMGKGMAAAMLMATVKAALRAVSQVTPPIAALHLAERALRPDLDRSESFVTLFHALLDVNRRTLSFADCGHGLGFLLRRDGTIEELLPRGLPLGIFSGSFQEGRVTFDSGDILILYSDGLIDALPKERQEKRVLADVLDGASSAREMVDRLIATVVTDTELPLPDDLTVLVIRAR